VTAWPERLYAGNAVLAALRDLFLSFAAEEEAKRQRALSAAARQAIDPTPLREALAALPQGPRMGEPATRSLGSLNLCCAVLCCAVRCGAVLCCCGLGYLLCLAAATWLLPLAPPGALAIHDEEPIRCICHSLCALRRLRPGSCILAPVPHPPTGTQMLARDGCAGEMSDTGDVLLTMCAWKASPELKNTACNITRGQSREA